MSQFELGSRQKQLVDALRSGKYKQAYYQLKKGDCYCVEGVACDLSGVGFWDGDTFICGSKWCKTLMPREVSSHYELRFHISVMNDVLSFEQIANKLEAEPGLYFYVSV